MTVLPLQACCGDRLDSLETILSPYYFLLVFNDDAVSVVISRGAVKAWVLTTSDFTPEGVDEARITGVNLVNGDDLIRSLDLYYPGQYCL